LLADIYHFSTLRLGLFAFIGVLGVSTGPFAGRFLDRLVGWAGNLIGGAIMLLSQILLTSGAGLSIGVPIVVCYFVDVGVQIQQVSITSRLYAIDPAMRSRVNAVYMVCWFLGQTIGAEVGSRVWLSCGWRVAGATMTGVMLLMHLILFVRGPHCDRYTWFGWEGGARLTKTREGVISSTTTTDEEKGSDGESSAPPELMPKDPAQVV